MTPIRLTSSFVVASLRPANKNPTKQTQGRKSNKRAKAAAAAKKTLGEELDENPAGDFEEAPDFPGDDEEGQEPVDPEDGDDSRYST